jgi:class 3 adenylate cyclase
VSRASGTYTPKRLADKILTSRAALEACPERGRRGERKQVTVLFADVTGSMELAEQLDPEEWSRIMQRFFQIPSEGVERFDGFVAKFTGDGIMALPGAPIAHEEYVRRTRPPKASGRRRKPPPSAGLRRTGLECGRRAAHRKGARRWR